MDEIVALYDAGGRPVGAAPRSRVRAENLRHAATAVVVRDLLGRVFVHRRTETKDVYPGRWDFAAGGVLLAGEDPFDAAAREAEEELGVTSELKPIGEGEFADDQTNYHGFLFETFWAGPVRLQPEEVAEGSWRTLEQVSEMLSDPALPLVPDTSALLGWWVRARLLDRTRPDQGWDSVAEIVEGRWLDRWPQRPEVAPRLRAEAVLMPAIAATLELAVPVPHVIDDEPLRIRHVLVTGMPCDPAGLSAVDGTVVGRFLRTLHDTPPDVYESTDVLDEARARADLDEGLAGLRERVLPLLPDGRKVDGHALLGAVATPTSACLVHGDLGPDHLYVTDSHVTGVIDWTDARIADPGVDLAWTLHGTPRAFADSLVAAYGVTARRRARGLLWHRLGPWWEALAGVDHLGQEHVESGLAGILARL